MTEAHLLKMQMSCSLKSFNSFFLLDFIYFCLFFLIEPTSSWIIDLLIAERWELLIFVFLGPHTQHMEVPRLGVKLELQLPAYTTATATPDLSHVFNLHSSSWQHQILNPLIKARDQTCILHPHGY